MDLYVLERAFASTHPESESLFGLVLEAYGKEAGKAWVGIKRRLDDGKPRNPPAHGGCSVKSSSSLVRLRGRKRSMVG